MISDNERREVARRLRGIKDTREGCGHDLCCDLWSAVFDSGYRCTDLCDECEVAVLNSLADLIEPEPERTCRDVGDGDKFVCSKCGASFDYEGRWDEPTYWVDDVAAVVEYCPNCGALVVDE